MSGHENWNRAWQGVVILSLIDRYISKYKYQGGRSCAGARVASPSSSRPPWSSTSPSCWSSSQCSSLCLRDFPRPPTSRWLMYGWCLCFWFLFLRYHLCPCPCFCLCLRLCLCLFVFTNVLLLQVLLHTIIDMMRLEYDREVNHHGTIRKVNSSQIKPTSSWQFRSMGKLMNQTTQKVGEAEDDNVLDSTVEMKKDAWAERHRLQQYHFKKHKKHTKTKSRLQILSVKTILKDRRNNLLSQQPRNWKRNNWWLRSCVNARRSPGNVEIDN